MLIILSLFYVSCTFFYFMLDVLCAYESDFKLYHYEIIIEKI